MDGLQWQILLKWMIRGCPHIWSHPNDALRIEWNQQRGDGTKEYLRQHFHEAATAQCLHSLPVSAKHGVSGRLRGQRFLPQNSNFHVEKDNQF